MQIYIIYGSNKSIWNGYNVGNQKTGLFPGEGKRICINSYKILLLHIYRYSIT